MEKYMLKAPEQIARIELYINKDRKSLDEIVKDTGCDYAVNGGLFNADWTACNHLRSGNVQYARDEWTYYGLAWNKEDNRFVMAHSRDEENYNNYISFCELIYKGKAKDKLTYPPAVGGARARTAAGFTKDGSTLLYCSTDALTPEALRDRLAEYGTVEFAIMLDGGGSTQGYFRGEYIKSSSRVVHNLLLVYLKKEQPTATPGVTAQQVIDCAMAEVGTRESGVNKIKYNTEYYGRAVSGSPFSWCCVFIWWLFHTLDADALYYGGEKTASCTTLYRWAASEGLAISGSYQPGDIVFFDWDGSGDCDHVGIVKRVNPDGSITTIEGNWNDCVSYVTRPAADVAKAYRPRYRPESDDAKNDDGDAKNDDDSYAAACAKLLAAGWGDVIKAMAAKL